MIKRRSFQLIVSFVGFASSDNPFEVVQIPSIVINICHITKRDNGVVNQQVMAVEVDEQLTLIESNTRPTGWCLDLNVLGYSHRCIS